MSDSFRRFILRGKRAPQRANPRARLAAFEQRAAKARELLLTQLCLEHVPEAMMLVTADARIVYANGRACRQLEYAREELQTMRIHDLDPDYPAHLWPEHWKDIRKLKSLSLETQHRAKSGRMMPVQVSIRHFTIGADEFCSSTVRDISERKQAEEALRQKQSEIVALSAPILQVAEGVVALPIIGELDAQRATQILDALLAECVRAGARFTILDLTGAGAVDAATAEHLFRIGRAVSLLGGRCALSGISPRTAKAIIELGVDMSAFLTFGTLRDALQHALKSVGSMGNAGKQRGRG